MSIVATEILDLKKIDEALKTIDAGLDSKAFSIYLEKHQSELDEAYEAENANSSEAGCSSEGFEMFAFRRFVTDGLKIIADMKIQIKTKK